MKTIEYRTIDKSQWPRGEWDEEPDKMQWPDQETGLPCLAVRHSESGHWCGYVGVSEGHPGFETEDVDVQVHGGITFGAFCDPSRGEGHGICHVPGPGEPDHVWWLGFDCHHLYDVAPTDEARRGYRDWGAHYKTLDYVRGECRDLARQLKEMTATGTTPVIEASSHD